MPEVHTYNKIYQKAFEIARSNKYFYDDDKLSSEDVEVFQKVEKALGKDLSSKIEGIHDYTKGILLTGGSSEQALGVVSYFWFTHLREVDKEKRMRHLQQGICIGTRGGMARLLNFRTGREKSDISFFSDLDSRHIEEFESLVMYAQRARPYKENKIYTPNGEIHKDYTWEVTPGYIIISTDKMPELRVNVLRLFDVIELVPTAKPQTTPGSASKTMFSWSIDNDKQGVCSNKKFVVKLSDIQFKLFKLLLKNKDKYVKKEILEKCWDVKPNYDRFLTDTMNKLENALDDGLKQKKIKVDNRLIETKTNIKRQYIAYKLSM